MAESLNETDSVDVSGSEENHMQALVSKLDLARKHKQQGNVKFEAKQYRGAIGEYHRAILYLKVMLSNCIDMTLVFVVSRISIYLISCLKDF
jgi:hypothetical protein